MTKKLLLLILCSCIVPAGVALAAVGPIDNEGYRGMDSLEPAPALQGQFMNLGVGTSASGTIAAADNPRDDSQYNFGFSSYGTMSMYGYNRTSFYVHTNGYITSSYEGAHFDNQSFPDSRFDSKQLIAPFFDDLFMIEGESSITWEAETGQWLIIQWNDFALYENQDARLTFRVTLGLDSNPSFVAFQYISMEGVGADGSSATIGIQDRYQEPVNQYAYNVEGLLATGTAPAGQAMMTIAYDQDDDGDMLINIVEQNLGTSDSEWDSDGGGVSDITEFVNGTNPNDNTDDDSTDSDGDGLSDLDEAFMGTDSANTDTDGDGLDDYDEVFNQGTDPTSTDTDGDSYSDPDELAAGSDPLDPGDFPTIDFSVDSNTKHKVRAVLDDDGNIHAIATNDDSDIDIYYYSFAADGTLLIAETLINVVPAGNDVKHPGISWHEGKVYITYEVIDDESLADMGVLILAPGSDDQNGDAADPVAITVANNLLHLPTNPRHHGIAKGPNGLHLTFTHMVEDGWPDGSGGEEMAGYAHVDWDGNLVTHKVLMEFNTKKGDGSDTFGVHKNHTVRAAVDEDGVAHVVFSAQSAPYYQYPDYNSYPTAMWYMAIDGDNTEGPYYIDHGMIERLDVQLHGSLLYISTTSGYDTNQNYYQTQGMRLAILDTKGYALVPRVGSYWDIDMAIAQGSMVLPFTSVYLNNEANQGGTLTVLDNGAAVIYFSPDWQDQLCLVAAGPDGSRLGDARCYFTDESSHYTRYKAIFQLDETRLGVVYNDWNSEMRYAVIELNQLMDLDDVPSVASTAPEITSTAVTYSVVDETYSYQVVATDEDGDISHYEVLSEDSTSGGMSFSDDGLLTWIPSKDDKVEVNVEIAAVDFQGNQGTQSFVITVYSGSACGCEASNGGQGAPTALAFLAMLGLGVMRRRF